ncbi:hypothetical protein PSE_4364 [Pseudovibrio sp. FO-BEG1]|nr:hypothetical protein PSE_4364 [Pseudovibrio sp. FO-BEG1]
MDVIAFRHGDSHMLALKHQCTRMVLWCALYRSMSAERAL